MKKYCRGWSRVGRGSGWGPDAATQKKKTIKKTPAGTTPPAITRPGSFMTPFGVPPLTLIYIYINTLEAGYSKKAFCSPSSWKIIVAGGSRVQVGPGRGGAEQKKIIWPAPLRHILCPIEAPPSRHPPQDGGLDSTVTTSSKRPWTFRVM